jgi:hypothetical protein
MAFDQSKDHVLWEDSVGGDKNTEVVVAVRQYEGSDPKVQISRRYFTQGGEGKFKKLGRLSKDELKNLIEFLPTVLEQF